MNLDERIKKLEDEEKELDSKLFGNPEVTQENDGDAHPDLEASKALEQVKVSEELSEQGDRPSSTMPEDPGAAEKLVELTKRFNNYKASGDRKLATLRSEVATLSSKLAAAIEENRTLKASLEAKISEEPDTFSAEDEKIFGKEALARLREREKALVEKQLKPLREAEAKRKQEEVDRLKRNAIDSQSEREAIFKTRLTDIRPNWEAELKDPNFIAFLKSDDEFGTPFVETFKMAEAQHNFVTLKQLYALYDSTKTVKPTTDPEIEKHKIPIPASSSSKAPVKGGKPAMTQAFVDQFYRDAAKGLYNKSPQKMKEADEIEARIDQWYSQRLR